MKRKIFIKEIDDYHDVIGTLKEEFDVGYGLSEFDSVYQDILDYEEDKFED